MGRLSQQEKIAFLSKNRVLRVFFPLNAHKGRAMGSLPFFGKVFFFDFFCCQNAGMV